MTALDRVLDALAAAPASDASYEPYGTNDPSKCWRCLGPAGTGASGVCDACRVVLLGDGPIEPAAVNHYEGFSLYGRPSATGYFEYNREGSFRASPNLDVLLDGNGPPLHEHLVCNVETGEQLTIRTPEGAERGCRIQVDGVIYEVLGHRTIVGPPRSSVALPAGSVRVGDRITFNIGGEVRVGAATFVVHANGDGTFQLRPAPIPEAVETFGHGGGRFRNATRSSRRRRASGS